MSAYEDKEFADGLVARFRTEDPEMRQRYMEFLEALTTDEVDAVLASREEDELAEFMDDFSDLSDEEVDKFLDADYLAEVTPEDIATYHAYLDSVRDPQWSARWSFQRFSLGAAWTTEGQQYKGWRHRIILGIGFLTIRFYWGRVYCTPF